MSGSLATNGYICKPPTIVTERVREITVDVEVDSKTVETSVEVIA